MFGHTVINLPDAQIQEPSDRGLGGRQGEGKETGGKGLAIVQERGTVIRSNMVAEVIHIWGRINRTQGLSEEEGGIDGVI